MDKLRIAIFGASGFGKFHAREFHNCGLDVVAILGSSKKSSVETSRALRREFGIQARSYNNIKTLLRLEKLDAVSICTPPNLHEEQIKRCLNSNLHVLCEKPLVLNSYYRNYSEAKDLFELARKQRRILTVNTQWVSVLSYLEYSKMVSFSALMESGKKKIEMLSDILPHLNSILVKLIPEGKPRDIEVSSFENEIIINFDYSSELNCCSAEYTLRHKQDRPRRIEFTFNDEKFIREIGENYHQYLLSEKRRIEIGDPLNKSIIKFIDAIRGETPLVSEKEILENIKLQDIIMERYMKK